MKKNFFSILFIAVIISAIGAETKLHNVVNDITELRSLIASGADVNAWAKGKTPLIVAVENISLEAVKLLINAGADVNAWNSKSPLMIAAENKSLEIVKLLINAGAEVNAKDNAGRTALAIAEEYGNSELVQILKKAKNNRR